jgi:hypothetical protein
MKNSIGNTTRDLPACRAVPQPTAPVTGHLASILTYVPAKTKQEYSLYRDIHSAYHCCLCYSSEHVYFLHVFCSFVP